MLQNNYFNSCPCLYKKYFLIILLKKLKKFVKKIKKFLKIINIPIAQNKGWFDCPELSGKDMRSIVIYPKIPLLYKTLPTALHSNSKFMFGRDF